MPMLLADLAEETSASNRRVADRLEAEARLLDNREGQSKEIQQQVLESARQATAYAVSRLPPVEGTWQLALAVLRKQPTGEEAEQLLRVFLGLFESAQRLVRSPRALWELARQMGAAAERLDDLDRAEARFKELAAEAELALEHRLRPWQPADTNRLALGLQLAREGKTVKADEVRERLRRAGG